MESSHQLPKQDTFTASHRLKQNIGAAIGESQLPLWLVLHIIDTCRAEILSLLYQQLAQGEGDEVDADATGSSK